MVGLGVDPPCLRVDSEETLLTLIDERAQSAHAAPGVTPGDSSEAGTPVRELIQLSVLGEPLVDCLQETMPEEQVECAIQATASIWEPLGQVHYVTTDDMEFHSFGMAPRDAGGIYDDSCQHHETLRTVMLQWLLQQLCRQAIINRLYRTMRMNMVNGLGRSLIIITDSPRIAVTPGEWYASETIWMMRTDLHQANEFAKIMSARCDYKTVESFSHVVSAAIDGSAVELNDLSFRRMSFPPYEVSAGRD